VRPTPKLVAEWSQACTLAQHHACPARLANGGTLLICPCACHDKGEGEQPITVPQTVSEWAAAMGRIGGPKGGRARAAKLSPARRSEIARKAAQARWWRPR
jgi:hypothetical protein